MLNFFQHPFRLTEPARAEAWILKQVQDDGCRKWQRRFWKMWMSR